MEGKLRQRIHSGNKRKWKQGRERKLTREPFPRTLNLLWLLTFKQIYRYYEPVVAPIFSDVYIIMRRLLDAITPAE